jgi:hypothetical protein
MDFVTIKHPHPEIVDAAVPASAVDHWRTVGWLTEAEYAAQVADTPEPGADPADTKQGDAVRPAASKPAAKARRSSTEEKD